LAKLCKAYANRTQETHPVKKPKKEIPHYVHVAGIIVRKGKVLLAQRPPNGLLGGMWEFPNGRVNGDPAKELVKTLRMGFRLKVQKKEALGVIQHAYTHFKVTVHAFLCELSASKNHHLKWVPVSDLGKYPMGKVDRMIATKLLSFLENN